MDQRRTALRYVRPSLAGRITRVLAALLFFIGCRGPGAQATEALPPAVHRQLGMVHEQLDREAYDAALPMLEALLRDTEAGSYARAVVLQTLGYVQVHREQWPAAIRSLQESLALHRLPLEAAQRVRYDLAQLCIAEDRKAQAAALLEQWFKDAADPSPQAYALLGQVYGQLQEYKKAIPFLEKAISRSVEPRAEWYEALLAMHYREQSFAACVRVLETLLRRFPDRGRYWRQLAAVHLEREDYQAAVTALELAYRDGALKAEQDRMQLVQLYLYTGLPYKAARLLEVQLRSGGIRDNSEHRELLAQAWSDARRRAEAIRALESVVSMDSPPELRLRLAQWYFEEQRWAAGAAVLEPLAKAAVGEPSARAWLMLGIARFEQSDTDAAREAFLEAVQSAAVSRPARQWLDFIGEISNRDS